MAVTTTDDPGKAKLPKKWTDVDHRIYDLRVRQQRSWREIGAAVNLSHVRARARFYDRMSRVTPADVAAMRAEENAKADEREGFLWRLALQAARPTMHRTTWPDGRVDEWEAPADFTGAVRAAAALTNEARHRARLNGIDVPVTQRHEVTVKGEARAEADALLEAYLMGATDAVTGHGPPARPAS